jgi:cell division protein FtsI (penicillin-binding protein 3)
MTPGIPHGARLRAHLAALTITVGLVGLGWRAWTLQIDDNGHYRELASRQHALTVDIPAPRGEVLDTHGRPLAVSADADSIWANPREIRDVTATADQLAVLMATEPAALEAKLAGDRRFVWIARHVKPELAAAVRAAKLAGIEVAREPRRWYPARTVGGSVIGRADIDGNGLDGIELAMNDALTGTRGAGRAVRDAKGRRMFADGLEQPAPGATVKLTLDRSLQAIADTALAEAVDAHRATNGVVVVLDVATSRVLAMASYPAYDPNQSGTASRNRAITDVFEVGSVMKVFTVAAALEAGAVTPETEFDVQMGLMMIGRHPIRDVHPEKYLTVAGIIKRSSNVGAVKIAMRLGKDKLHEALLRFGFAGKTKIELPGEQAGRLRSATSWRDIEFATISYGYGLTVTPLQIGAALAAIGNDGIYHAPRIVDEVVDAGGNTLPRATAEARRVVSVRTATQMRAMLASVFEGGKLNGTASSIVVPGFKCGGKTGTAHKYDPATKRYADHRYLSSFIGLAPIEQPRLAIVVLVDEPSGGDYYGGLVAGPVFARVASESLRYLGVPGETLQCAAPVAGPVNPFAVTPPKTCVVPAPKPPRVVAGKPAPPVAIAAPPPLEGPLEVPVEGTVIPDFRGMGLRRAIDTAREHELGIEILGSGRVVGQDPAPGPAIASRVTLRFSDGDSPSQPGPPVAP